MPWLRENIGAGAEKLIAGAFQGVSVGELAALARRFVTPDPRKIVGLVRSGEWLSPFVGEQRQRVVRRLNATMAIVEGYSEHVMDAVGEDLDPAYLDLRDRVDANRANRGPLEAIVSRLLGIDLKMRQYRVGKAFCDEVVSRRGIKTLNKAWSEPAALPRPSELEHPGRWLSRVA